MNIEEARTILSSSKRKDFEDPAVVEALKLAESNPELQGWIDDQARTDAKISSALNDVPVPEGLEQQLIRAVKVKPILRNKKSRKTTWLYGIAALLIFGIGTAFVVTHDGIVQKLQSKVRGESFEDFDSFRDGMAYFIAKTYFLLDHQTDDISSIEDWLQRNEAPVYEGLPEALLALNPIGCKEFKWKENKVSLVCFHSKEGKIVHLFIMERSGAAEEWNEDFTTVAYSNGLETGGWTSGKKVYLLVGSDPEVDIQFALI